MSKQENAAALAAAARDDLTKSTVTCDMEGRIETFNKGAQKIFGYTPDEVIGKQRVSLFSPGLVVLAHVPDWLKAARETGEFKSRTVFVRKDGSTFAADIRITPTYKEGVMAGYCGVTTPRPDIPVSEALPTIPLFTRIFRWLVVTRAPFLTATIVPILLGAAWVAAVLNVTPYPWLPFALAMVGGVALHVAANTYNDYFDWTSGTDKLNNNYFLPFTGGSRSIELGLISEKGLFRLASSALGIGLACGLALMALGRTNLIWFGLVGAFATYFYTAPPIRLAARRGLGELFVGLSFGPFMTAGTIYALSGTLSPVDFLVGLPVGLLIIAVLYINEFPDMESDMAAGKVHLVAALGKKAARWGYAALVFGAFIAIGWAVYAKLFPAGTLIALLTLPIALYTTATLFQRYADRSLVSANQ
jgi:1,4-dihydroxy-2-naphthoate octaprenyltransferase